MSAEQTPDIADLAAVLKAHGAYGIEVESDAWSCICGEIIWDGNDSDGGDLDDDYHAHVAAALAPVLAAADERAYLRGYEAGLLAPQSEWMKARDRDLREAEQRALREAAAVIDGYGNSDLDELADQLRDHADRITEPVSHEAATSGEEASKA